MRLATPLGTRGPSGLATIVDEREGVEEKPAFCSPPQSLVSSSPISNSTNHDENESNGFDKSIGRKHRRHRSVPVLSASIDRAKQSLKRRSQGEADHERLYFTEINSIKAVCEQENQSSMDGRRAAMGPRPPSHHPIGAGEHSDDQRTQAFESIFGRPSAAHRDAQPPRAQQRLPLPVNPSPYYGQPYSQPTMQQQQRHLQPMAFQQQQQQQQYQRSIRAQEQPYGYPYGYSNSNYTPSSIGSAGVITSPPPPASDPSLDVFTNRGLTPAQAYQAKVFAEGRGGVPPGTLLPTSHNNDPLSLPPRLDSLTLSDNGGRLSLDFDHHSPPASNGSMNRGPQQTFAKLDDELEGDSELPWANAGQRTPTSNLPGKPANSQENWRSSTLSNTPPSSVDTHDYRSAGPPRLNLDFGGSNFLSPNPQADGQSSGRPSMDSMRAMPQATLPQINTSHSNVSTPPHSSASASTSTSASSSFARRSLPSDNARVRTPLSALSFPQSSSASTSASSSTTAVAATPGTPVSQTSLVPKRTNRRAPLVYPALLSRVSEALLQRLPLSVRTKDGLSYADAFDGREAVDKICYIIKTTDRSLALLLGRALDAQKFFHDVTYDHRLRDNPNEIYQFKINVGSLGLTGGANGNAGLMGHTRGDSRNLSPNNSFSISHRPSMSKGSTHESGMTAYTTNGRHYQSNTDTTVTPLSNQSSASHSQSHGPDDSNVEHNQISTADLDLPTGVFTILTECYSATCSRDQLCYSITCPRRMEQQYRQNRPSSPNGRSLSSPSRVGRRATIGGSNPLPGANGSWSGAASPVGSGSGHGHLPAGAAPRKESIEDDDDATVETGQLWIHSVPKEVADALSDVEKRRQEAINEVVYTERDFVRDMEYLRDVWVAGIRESDVIPIERRDAFISQVFWNLLAIIDVNTRLRDALSKRQKQYTVVGEIGDIFKEIVPLFDPFVEYGAHQMYGKYEFEKEKSNNPAFAEFVEEIERRPDSRKLELNGYLTKPTTRLARYPLLLEAVLKHTSDSSPDKVALQEVVQSVRVFLTRVNQKSGEAENRFHLHQLERQLQFRPGEYVDLKLSSENRKLIYKGSLNRRGGAGDKEDLQVFLFDHALLMVKQKGKADHHKVFRRPIPLEFLHVSAAEEFTNTPTLRPSTTGRTGGKAALIKPQHDLSHPSLSSNSSHHSGHSTALSLTSANGSLAANNKNGFPITFTHLGWRRYSLTLWAPTFISKKMWLENIQKQQDLMNERSRVFETAPFSEGFFTGSNRVNCAAPFSDSRQIAYGTDDGVYFSDLRHPNRPPIKMLALLEVTQVEILQQSDLLIVLSERNVITFPLEALDPRDPTAGQKRGKRIATHTSFFKAGICMGRPIVCVVKTSALSTTVKTFEPIDQQIRGKSKPTFKKLLQGGNDTLKLFKEFYIPVESHSLTILRSRLCIGCARGFQIVDLESLDTQPLVDPSDPSLEFIEKKDNLRPLAIFRVDTEFLLCYDEWAFFVDKHGFRARGEWKACWEGRPTAFAFHYPYVIAVEPTFIEIWDVTTCTIKQVIHGDNLRCLFAESPPSGTMYYANPQMHQQGMNGMGGQPGYGHPPPHLTGPYPPRGSSASLHHQQPGHMPPHMYPGGRPSLQGPGATYGMQPSPVGYGPVAPVYDGYGFGRREILLGSDDNIMFLKPVDPPPPASAI
ncbi:hypothetical protein M408DRAFT_331185 [Serendipita vermifera MAFF 305830]|uniref:DH domain-containing protein n=1 Tax=Serendipita vermifera MAFF 305830 TaxID=933852 RepID=A0A0C3ALG1_SERVB|nr:hypothetical protein M408DRAFT_331185 [Serendipita vermifera MAFF 305830]